MKLELIRTYYPKATNGELFLNGNRVCSTIELPWNNNMPRDSCIPEGEYELRKRWSQRFGNHFILVSVPDRSQILMHPANDALKELKGCIAPVSFLIGEGRGLLSRKALEMVKQLIDPLIQQNKKIFLIIKTKQNEPDSNKNEKADA
jgi:hypothetical protein